MPRPFLALALVAASLLVAGFAAGLAGSASGGRLGVAGTVATLAVHGSVWAYLRATGRRVEGLARAAGMPGWVGAQAEKNRRKAFASGAIGVPLALLAGWSGAEGWRLSLGSANLAFQLGAFIGESAMMMAQTRLIRDVEAWVASA